MKHASAANLLKSHKRDRMILKLTVVGALVAEAKPYKLPFAGWVVVVLFFCSMALLPWAAAVFGRRWGLIL